MSSPSRAEPVAGMWRKEGVVSHRRLCPGEGSFRGCIPRTVQTPVIAGAAVGCVSGGSWRSQPFFRGMAELGHGCEGAMNSATRSPTISPLIEMDDRRPAALASCAIGGRQVERDLRILESVIICHILGMAICIFDVKLCNNLYQSDNSVYKFAAHTITSHEYDIQSN